MNLAPSDRARIDLYLAELRRALAELPADRRDELLREIESHLIDAIADVAVGDDARVEIAIARLGPPGDYAEALVAEHLLDEGTRGFRPATLAGGLARRMGLGVGRAAGGLVFAFGYLFLLMVAIATLAKPFVPEAGLWLHASGGWSLSLQAHENSREVLGWWIIPLGLTVLVLGWSLLNMALRFLIRLEAAARRA